MWPFRKSPPPAPKPGDGDHPAEVGRRARRAQFTERVEALQRFAPGTVVIAPPDLGVVWNRAEPHYENRYEALGMLHAVLKEMQP